jgi:hypothetical protein
VVGLTCALRSLHGKTDNSPKPNTAIHDYRAEGDAFYDNTGTFSADVAAEDDGLFLVPSILWNATIPGGVRPGALSSVLVTVEVTGETEGPPLPRKIVLTARYIALNRITGNRHNEDCLYFNWRERQIHRRLLAG